MDFVRIFCSYMAGISAPLVGLTKEEAAKEVAKRRGPTQDQAEAK